MRPPLWLVWTILVMLTGGAVAAELPLRQVVEGLIKAKPGAPADFSGQNLFGLDLSDLDFKGAKLAGANLMGANLSGAKLAHADLAHANLDRALISRADFSGADLSQATLYDTVGSLNAEVSASEAPNFMKADLSGARIMAFLSHANMRGAKLVGALLGKGRNQLKTPQRTDLSGADLSGADLAHADLGEVLLSFANLADANLAGADLTGAELAHANLAGADLAHADLTGADLDGTVLRHARLDDVRGLDHARHRDRAIY